MAVPSCPTPFVVRAPDGKLIPDRVEEAKKAALDLSNQLLQGGVLQTAVTVQEAFRIFRREVVADMEGKHKAETERALTLWETFLGPRHHL